MQRYRFTFGVGGADFDMATARDGVALDGIAGILHRLDNGREVRPGCLLAGASICDLDFDLATRDPLTGGLRAEFQPNSSIGGPGDALHPNRAGYLTMGNAVDLQLIAGPRK